MSKYNFVSLIIIISSVILAQGMASFVVNMMDDFLLHTACVVSFGFFLTCIGLGSFNHYLNKEEQKRKEQEQSKDE